MFVKVRGDLQGAINAAAPGDTIVLAAGATFAPISLPAKSGSTYITIQSSRAAELSAGARVSPAQSSLMARIVTSQNDNAAIAASPGAHHFKFIGIEITIAPTVTHTYELISLGRYGADYDTLAELPHDFVFDRCYIHANDGQAAQRGLMMNSAETSVINSYISNFKDKGFDTQAIASWNGPGPFHIINNYLEGAGENVIFGGSDPSVPNLVASDIEIRNNYFFKPLSWRGVWTVKNLIEFKNAQRVVVDGNTFENAWVDGQAGFAVLFTVRNQDGGCPWCVVRDIQFTNNVVKKASSGVQILGMDYFHPSQRTTNILLRNNLFDEISPADNRGGNGAFLVATDGSDSVVFDHNTIRQSGNLISLGGAAQTAFTFTNNVAPHNQYGIIGDGHGPGNDSITTYLPGVKMLGNVITGANAGIYPAGNFYPADLSGLSGLKGTDGLVPGYQQTSVSAIPEPTVNPTPTVTPITTAASPSVASLSLTGGAQEVLLTEGMGVSGDKLNVRANAVNAGSVKFEDGSYSWTESVAPFCMFGDNGERGALAVGAHTLKVTPYAGLNATGTAGLTMTVNFTVGNSPQPTPTVTITPTNQKPVANVGGPYGGMAGQSIQVDGSRSFDADGTIGEYAWNFGDGTGAMSATTSHVYAAPGTFTVTLTVKDNVGATSSMSTTATIGTTQSAPNAPTNLTVNELSGSGNALVLNWQDNSNNESTFSIERWTSQSQPAPISNAPADTTVYTDAAVSNNTTYNYRVCASNNMGFSCSNIAMKKVSTAGARKDRKNVSTVVVNTAPVVTSISSSSGGRLQSQPTQEKTNLRMVTMEESQKMYRRLRDREP